MSEHEPEIIEPPLSPWQYFGMENTLRSERSDVPNLRLANVMRRHLAGVVLELSERHGLTGWHEIQDLSPQQVRQLTATQIGALAVRSASAAITLVASGYEPETTVHLRRLIECTLRLRASLDDDSGQHARQWLVGRARPSAEKLAQRFGTRDELALLSISAHADARGMALLQARDFSSDGVETVPLLPHRDARKARALMYGVAYECGMVGAGLAQAFGVAVRFPSWASNELRAARDALETVEGDTTDDPAKR